MPGPITAQHKWVIAATIEVEERIARKGVQRGVVRIPVATKIDVMETYCGQCRKTYEDVADVPCSADTGTEHLRGGPIGVRAKRTSSTAAAIAQPVVRPTPRPVPLPTPALRPVAAAAEPAPLYLRPPRRCRTVPVHPAAVMLPFDLDTTLTG